MNLYQNNIDTMQSKNFNDELSRLPKWAVNEQFYNCDNEKEEKQKKVKQKKNKKRLFEFK